MSLDRADAYMDNVAHVTTWEEAAAHMALFLLWASDQGLARAPVAADLRRLPFAEFLAAFVATHPLKFTDDLVSEGQRFAAEHYEAFASEFAPPNRAHSVLHAGEAGWTAAHTWLDEALAVFRRARGEPPGPPQHDLAHAVGELLARCGEPHDEATLTPVIARLSPAVRAALEAPLAREWLRFTVARDKPAQAGPGVMLVRPTPSVEYTNYGAPRLAIRDGRAFAGEADVTAALDIHDRLELFGDEACVEWLLAHVDTGPDGLPRSAWRSLARACLFVRLREAELESPHPIGSVLTREDFQARVAARLGSGERPPVGQFAYVPPRLAGAYLRPWAERVAG
ncbi:hypothetical protein [Nannocystis bainbridge]|uniref:DUF2398 family protein n=1 Tax=Nannocystis bainbridge TaxID=2995303 RepID=A0ABT5DWR2_9BACT|nr:hypothetical protein [Nannocystis bainbridge]MDC0718072.1 hypothetical protein [Nannocystis bainbridge]